MFCFALSILQEPTIGLLQMDHASDWKGVGERRMCLAESCSRCFNPAMQRTGSSQGHLKLLLCVAPPLARWVLLVPLVLSALGPVRSVCGISAVRLPAGSIATCWSQKSYDSTHLPRSRIWCRGWVFFWADVVGGEHEKVLKFHAVVPTKAETKCRTTCFCNQFAMVICRKRKFWKTYSSHLMTWHVTDPCDRWVSGLTHDRFREKDKMGRRVISDFVRLYLDIAQVCTGIESTFHLGESNPTQNLWESLAWKIFSSYSLHTTLHPPGALHTPDTPDTPASLWWYGNKNILLTSVDCCNQFPGLDLMIRLSSILMDFTPTTRCRFPSSAEAEVWLKITTREDFQHSDRSYDIWQNPSRTSLVPKCYQPYSPNVSISSNIYIS